MKKDIVAVIGGGPAGLGAVSALQMHNVETMLIDKNEQLGGHLLQWHQLNPSFILANDALQNMGNPADWKNLTVLSNTVANAITHHKNGKFNIALNNGTTQTVDTIVYAGGFKEFDARKKEELGYGIYQRVLTSVDIEQYLSGQMKFNFELCDTPQIGFVHCVGSRDIKCGNLYCSRICCMVGVKQAIELKQKYPNAQITCFYMDLRMAGRGYEELYLKAQQEYGIRFVRGRVSEVSESQSKSVQVKAEDTLLARPIRGEFDLLVLLVGMEPLADNPLGDLIPTDTDGFALDHFATQLPTIGKHEGLFWAGTCKGPSSSADAFCDGQHAGLEALQYLKSRLA